jgi:hypothetical protein
MTGRDDQTVARRGSLSIGHCAKTARSVGPPGRLMTRFGRKALGSVAARVAPEDYNTFTRNAGQVQPA